MKKFLSSILVISALLISTGCASNRATAVVTPGVDLKEIQHVHIIRSSTDERGVAEVIEGALDEMGLQYSTGSPEESPPETDATLTYIDRWMWDITMYLLELTIKLEDPQADFVLASGNSFHTSLTRLSPEKMVREVLGNMFSPEEGAAE